MKPSPSANKNNHHGGEEEGSTVDVQHQNNIAPNGEGGCCTLNGNNDNTPATAAAASNLKQQAWFQSSVGARTEAYVEAQVMQLTEECRLFNNDDCGGEDSSSNNSHNLALFQRHEIQASWTLLGNGAFSEVYNVQSIKLLDSGFVDPVQQEAREYLRDNVALGRQQQQQDTIVSTKESQKRQEQYVMKHLRRDLLSNRKKFIHAAGDLVLEAMYLSKLYHPNIISLCGCAVGGPNAYSDGRHDGFFLILERMDQTLARRIQEWEKLVSSGTCPDSARKVYSKHLIDFEEKLDIALQVGRALEYLHSKDIIFRDLKPDNIGLIDRPDGKTVAKLFDFGLCRELPEASPQENKVFHMSGVGTRRYMSPEVFLGQYYNVKADVYSWSMVLHSMLSLQRPFEMYNAELHKLLVCLEGVRPTIYKEWPVQIQLLLRKGWAHSPMDRPPMGILVADIVDMLGEIESAKDSLSDSKEDIHHRRQPPKNGNNEGSDTFVGQSFANFFDSLAESLCSGSGDSANKTKRSRRSLLRTLEAQLVADAAGTQLLMLRDHPHSHFRDRVGADYPQVRHLRSKRSSYL